MCSQHLKNIGAHSVATKAKLKVTDDGSRSYVRNLTQKIVTNSDDVAALLVLARSRRVKHKTLMNETSSRSHLLLQAFGTIRRAECPTGRAT